MLRTIAAITIAGAVAPAGAQDLVHKAAPQDHAIFITGATVHTVSGDPIENGVVAFNEGVITLIGDASVMSRVSLDADAEVIDARGMHVWPGLIGSATYLGLTEIGAVRATHDYDEVGDMTPEVRAYISVNPDSTLIPVARSAGVLVVNVMPRGGRIPGRASVVRLDGWTNDDMAVLPDAGLVINWPSMRPSDSRFSSTPEAEQRKAIQENLDKLDDAFGAATAYAEARRAGRSQPIDLALEALATTLPGADDQRPVFINANDLDQITSAIAWAARRGLAPVIVGGRDAPLCAELLVANDVPVIVTGTHRFPKRADSPYDDAYTLPARLQAAGVRWCLASGEEAQDERRLANNAGMAAAHGLDLAQAVRGVTLSAAEILGLGETLGSIERGKSATLIVTDGHVLESTTVVTHAFIDGRTIDLGDKQKALRDKYRDKYRQLDVID